MNKRNYSQRSLHGQVVHELGQRILRGDYPPETNLPNEEMLATAMQVSRTALREAVKVLTAKGLIESRPKVGTRVRPRLAWNMLDPDVLAWHCATMQTGLFAKNLLEMREIIEPAAAGLAARNRTAEQLDLIAAAFGDMARSGDLEEWVGADLQFHKAILHASGNELLAPLASLIETALETLFTYSARNANDHKYSLPDHEKVWLAIRDQDEAAAFQHMSGLLAGTRANLADRLDQIAPAAALHTLQRPVPAM